MPLRTSQRVAAIVAVLLTTAPLTSAAVVVTNGNAQTIALNDAVAGSGYGGDAQQLPKVVELCWFTGTGRRDWYSNRRDGLYWNRRSGPCTSNEPPRGARVRTFVTTYDM